MKYSLVSPDTTILAFPTTGVRTCNESGKYRTWKPDEFIFVSAIDTSNRCFVHGEKYHQRHFIAASQIEYIIATDTVSNRALLENFETNTIQWVTQYEPKSRIAPCLAEQELRRELSRRLMEQLHSGNPKTQSSMLGISVAVNAQN